MAFTVDKSRLNDVMGMGALQPWLALCAGVLSVDRVASPEALPAGGFASPTAARHPAKLTTRVASTRAGNLREWVCARDAVAW
jgi:hypothetical protein